MKPLVSVIVPIYNVEKYLSKCIESIINQTLSNIEIILVNDGSTDSSGVIADNYAKKDSRIRVIHKKNGGQGSARNTGIELASGEYIGFVDSDDWIDLDMYEKLYNKSNKYKSDIAIGSRKVFNENYDLVTTVTVGDNEFDNISKNIVDYILKNVFYPQTVSACNKLYSRKLLLNNNIRFRSVEEVGSEDAVFNYCTLLNTNKIVTINDTFYNGVERLGSTTRQYNIGAMKKTAKLLESIYIYSESINKSHIGEVMAPVFLLFFQQYNYNLIKTYGKENVIDFVVEEQKLAEENKYFKKAEKDFIFNKHLTTYFKAMGYSKKGIVFMKIYMWLSLNGLYKLSAKVRCYL